MGLTEVRNGLPGWERVQTEFNRRNHLFHAAGPTLGGRLTSQSQFKSIRKQPSRLLSGCVFYWGFTVADDSPYKQLTMPRLTGFLFL